MPDLMVVDGHQFQLTLFTLADTARDTILEQSTAIFKVFLEREAEFKVHGSVVIDYPDISDMSRSGFLADAAAYAASRAASAWEGTDAPKIVVLTTYADVVRPSLEMAGYELVAIDMPAGPEHTAAFILAPDVSTGDGRTLYIEAVDEDDEKIKPSFVLRLEDSMGRLCGGAYGVIHERQGVRYAYLATMSLVSALPQGTGTALIEQLVRYLREQKVHTVHLGTQTAANFYEKNGFKVDQVILRRLRVRRREGREVHGDLAMMSMTL